MTPKELENKLRDLLRCCRANNCDITAINEELTEIQATLEDHEIRITILEGGLTTVITVVSNYSALPDPTTVPGQFYFTENSQGTKWLPGSIGGTYYPGGQLYYSNGAAWITSVSPWNAPQATVDAGLDDEAFVTSNTLANATTVSHPGHTHVAADITDFVAEAKTAVVDNSITNGITDKAPSEDAVFDALALKADANDVVNSISKSGDLLLVGDVTLSGGANITLTQVGQDIQFAGSASYTDEQAQDAVGGIFDGTLIYTDGTPLIERAALTGAITANQGSNTTALGSFSKAQLDTAVNDGNVLYVGDVTQYTDELAQDAVGAMIDTTLEYVDGTPLLKRAALTGAITASSGSNATSLGTFTKSDLSTAVSDGDVLFVGDVTSGISEAEVWARVTLGL